MIDMPLGSKIIMLLQRMKISVHLTMLVSFFTIAVLMLGLFFKELYDVFFHHVLHSSYATGFLHAFGTLLVLWTITELINSEIQVLRGHHFSVSILVDVAMAAVIRKILLSDFKIDMDFFVSILSLMALSYVRKVISISDSCDARTEAV